MSRLLFFNPENDGALALDHHSFTPSRAAATLHRAGALLPMWWAEQGDKVLVDDPALIPIAADMARRYGLYGRAVTHCKTAHLPSPWGWSHYTRRIMAQAGVPDIFLPTLSTLIEWRDLSHRRTAITLNRLIGTSEHLIPVEATSVGQALAAVDRFGRAVAKLPWSSSGRGVLFCHDIPRPTLTDYLGGIIHRQSSVIIEPYYERVQDFAALFYSTGGKIGYCGLSLFATNSRGNYTSNIVAPQNILRARLGLDIIPVVKKLEAALSIVLAHSSYWGYLGVDMLLYRDADGAIQIAPCIEMNLRNTMGVLSLHLAKKLLRPDGTATLIVAPTPPSATAIDLSPVPSSPLHFYLDISESIS